MNKLTRGRRNIPDVEVVSENALRISARVIGPSSAAQKALDDMERRRQKGEAPICVQVNDNLLVVDEKDLGTTK